MKLRTKFYGHLRLYNYIDESGETLFFIYIYFSEVYYENQKSKCKAWCTFKGINCFGTKENG